MSKRDSTGNGGPSRERGRTGQPPPDPPARPPTETIGSILTSIATSLNEALRMFQYADKRLWDPTGDEYEQIRALEETLVEAKRDFVEMGRLVGGGLYYEGDRRGDSLAELRTLATRFASHAQTFKDWLRTGGPINPLWVKDTLSLRRDLHRAQCRAARRIFVSDQEGSESSAAARCLGGFIVYRALRRVRNERKDRPAWQAGDQQQRRSRRGSLESVVPECNTIGQFERLGDTDVAFVCDYCDGFLVWPDLKTIPAERREPEKAVVEGGYPNWAAAGRSCNPDEEEERAVVFVPLAIANHLPPRTGEWMARIVCPFCEEYTYIDQGDGDGERKWEQPEGGFESVEALREHLAWSHTALPRPVMPGLGTGKCAVM